MDAEEYAIVVKGFEIKEQLEWDRARTIAFFAGAGDFKNLKIEKIRHLPYLDEGKQGGNWERFKEILDKSKNATKGSGG